MTKKIIFSLTALFSPLFVFAETTCRVNGQIVDCPEFIKNIGPLLPFLLLGWLAVIVFFIVAGWKLFTKAGKPGWAVLIPFYNVIVMLEIVDCPRWWIFLLFIPIVNIVIGIIVLNDLSKSFGKGSGFTVGLIFLNIIFFPILAFGKSQYTKPIREAAPLTP